MGRILGVAGFGLWAVVGTLKAQPAPGAPLTHGAAIDAAEHAAPVPGKIVIHLTDGVPEADFAALGAYPFNVPDMTAPNHPSVADAEKQIPAVIKELDGKTVRIRGFMMPVKEQQGKTTEFLITRCQPSCCFAGAAQINDFITVKAPGAGFPTMLDDAVTIQGTLHVGAILDSGYIVGVYALDADKVLSPKG